MRIYNLKNLNTGEDKYFLKKANIAKNLGANVDRVEVAVFKNRPIKKHGGEKYLIEYRDIDVGVKIEDEDI